MRGLEVVFNEPLHKTPSGVSPGGAVFSFECLQGYDLTKNLLVLRADYEANQLLGDGVCIFFQSEAPNTPKMVVHKDLIVSIKDLTSGRILYPSLKTG